MARVDVLITQVLRRINELLPSTPTRWTRAEILTFVNDGLSELNLIAGDYQSTLDITINSTDNVYDIPSGVIGPMSVRIFNRYLLRESVMDLDNEAEWESSLAKRMNITTWCPLGLYMIVIHPRPFVPQTAHVECLSQHTPVTDSAMDLPIRPEYDIAVEDFCVSRAMFKEGGAEAAQAQAIYNKFLDTVQDLSGRNIIRSYPAWDVRESKTSENTLREGSLLEQIKGKQ